MNEKWIDIIGTKGYQISSVGRLKSLAKEWKCGIGTTRRKSETIMSWASDHNGYKITSIRVDGKSIMISQHRMLAIHFIPNPENKREVNHINGIKFDNRLENLEWVSSSENRQHAYDTGLKSSRSGSKHWNSKPILCIVKEGGRVISFPNIAMGAKYFGISECKLRSRVKGRTQKDNIKVEYI